MELPLVFIYLTSTYSGNVSTISVTNPTPLPSRSPRVLTTDGLLSAPPVAIHTDPLRRVRVAGAVVLQLKALIAPVDGHGAVLEAGSVSRAATLHLPAARLERRRLSTAQLWRRGGARG